MAFSQRSGETEFRFYWNGANNGWGTRILKPPNYSAEMQRWRGRLTQTRDTVTFRDEDEALLTALDTAGTAVDDEFMLTGRLGAEDFGTLFTGHCKDYGWENGVLSMSIANRFEELRSGRFVSNYVLLHDYDNNEYKVGGLSGTEIILNQPIILNRSGAVAYGSGPDNVVFLATSSILAFDAGTDPDALDAPWEFSIAGFPNEGGGIATSIAMRIDIETAGQVGNNLYTPEDKEFVGKPQTLIREFVGGTCTDVGWTEDEDFVIAETDLLDQVEMRVPVQYRANADINVLSVLDHICEQALISAWPDRGGTVHFLPYTMIDLAAASDGTLGTTTVNNLSYLYDSDEVITTLELYFGYESDADSELDEWAGHKRFTVPDYWPGQSGVQRTESFQAQYMFRPETARYLALRILGRHFKGVPQLDLDCLPTAATVTIGEIETIYWNLLDVNGAYYEVTAIRDDWDRSSIAVVLQSGTALYEALGQGEWEDGAWGVDHAVTGTSKFGWGDGTLGDSDIGTCRGIDVSTYGTTFRWAGA